MNSKLATLRRVLLATLFAAAVVAPSRRAHAQLLSPGPLHKAHASVEGDTHCGDCHSSGKRVDRGLCLKCHDDLDAHMNANRGLHALQYKSKTCESCHVDHLGGKGFTPWPGGAPSKLDHAQTGWPLNGAHQKPACTKCHEKRNSRGNASYLTANTPCVSCHKDVHEGRFGNTGNVCLDCHNENDWKTLKLDNFNHDKTRYPLKGAHKTVKCEKCHFEPPKWVDLKFQQCVDCHKDVHNGKLGPKCTECHDESKWKPVTFAAMAPRHPGTALGNGHSSVACVTCHDRGNLVAPSKGSECVSCHAPIHKAPFGRGCASCHASILWVGLPRSIGLSSHPKTDYNLTGKHEEAPCAGCHKPAMPHDQRYRGLAFARCNDCHEDKHNGEFAKAERGECRPCHATTGFSPTLFGTVAHASTRFPLSGRHTATACLGCHTAPRPRYDLRVDKKACLDCHANPHGDQFAKEMAQGGCAHCHEPTGWNSPKIDHSTWPLTGAHATAECDSCHHPTPEDKKTGKGASYRGVPRDCAGCHDDVHLGQFRLSAPIKECDACHSTKGYKIPNFDHNAMTGWALTGAHATTPCAKCHTMVTVRESRQTTRWRGLSQECKFCHANPHEQRGPA